MKDTAWVINSDAKIIDVNNAAVNVLGYSRDEFLSMRIKDIDSNLDPAVIKSLVDNMPRDKLQVFSTEHTTKSGKKIPVEICSSLVDYKGKQVILSIARDITERKKAEACSEKLMDDLRVINEKLEVVGNLTRHDARNKLAVITNNVFLLKHMLAGNQNALDHLASVELALEHIEELFSFAKNYELLGIQKLDDINVTQCIQEATAILDLRGIQLVNNCNCLCLRADLLLRQLFYNLIDNSLRHGKSVTCIKICYELNKDNLKLIYEDNGVGISEADKANMFKKGYGKGTGYGLYLIKRLCATYGWEIKEIGTPGNGVRFVIDISEDKYKFNKTTKQECQFSFS
jgi:PAS domain S-box-containing protein